MSEQEHLLTTPGLDAMSSLRFCRPTVRVRALREPGFLASFALCLVVSFGLVWIYVAAMPMAFLNRDYPLLVAKRSLTEACRPGIAVFGDSRALAATVPSVMPLTVTNLAMSGTSPIETYFAVRRALDCRTPPRLVVIAHAALKFSGDSDYWNVGVRDGLLSLRDMRMVDADAARLHDGELRDLRHDQLPLLVRDVLFALRFPSFYFDSLVNGFVAGRWLYNRQALRDCLAQSGHALFGRAAGSDGLAAEAEVGTFAASPLVDLYVSRTLALLAHRHVPVIFITIPMNRATFMRMTPALADGFSNYLGLKAMQFPSLRLIGPAVSCWPDRYFGDAWHFNAGGANAYSRVLGSWLQHALGEGAGDSSGPMRATIGQPCPQPRPKG